jgi:hypothetical protein
MTLSPPRTWNSFDAEALVLSGATSIGWAEGKARPILHQSELRCRCCCRSAWLLISLLALQSVLSSDKRVFSLRPH